MPLVAVPRGLREKLGDDGVDGLIQIVSEVEKEARRDSLIIAEERFERRLTEEISKLRQEMVERFAQMDTKFETRFAQIEAKFETKFAQMEAKMSSFKTEIIKWMFLFWIGQIAVIAGLLRLLR